MRDRPAVRRRPRRRVLSFGRTQARRYQLYTPKVLDQEATATGVTTIRQVLKALGVTIAVVLLLGAKGIVQTARGMSPGPIESAILTVGNDSLAVEEFFHLTWPWDDFQAVLGHTVQPAVPPLLQVPPPAVPVSYPAGNGSKRLHGHSATGSPGKGHRHKRQYRHRRVRWPSIPGITKSHPFTVLITGDSLVGYIGPWILAEASAQGSAIGWTDSIEGTGLTTPDFFDWSLEASKQVRQYHPDGVVAMMGGNDFENMTLPNGAFFLAGTNRWRREYQRRAEFVMRNWIKGGVRRVYWLSLPPAANPSWARDDYQINIALRHAAAQVPGVHYVNVLGPILNHGHYTDYVNVNGQPTLIREPDGVHLNNAGSEIVANEVVPILKRQWHFGWSRVRAREHHRRPRQKVGRRTSVVGRR